MVLPTIELEQELWRKGYRYVGGIDEVGRGPLAGPIVVACVILENVSQVVDGVRDSKTLSLKQRTELFNKIKDISTGWGVGIVTNYEIDEFGLSYSIKEAISRSLHDLEANFLFKPDYLLLDGGIGTLSNYTTRVINKGDSLHYSIAASSITAKVIRDNMMCEYAEKYPAYDFEKNVGYGTKAHMEALEKHGPCELHRRSFKPIAKFFKE